MCMSSLISTSRGPWIPCLLFSVYQMVPSSFRVLFLWLPHMAVWEPYVANERNGSHREKLLKSPPQSPTPVCAPLWILNVLKSFRIEGLVLMSWCCREVMETSGVGASRRMQVFSLSVPLKDPDISPCTHLSVCLSSSLLFFPSSLSLCNAFLSHFSLLLFSPPPPSVLFPLFFLLSQMPGGEQLCSTCSMPRRFCIDTDPKQ